VSVNTIVIYASPNQNGLTAACAAAAAEGARRAGSAVEEICLNQQHVGMCQACDEGWGTCRTEHECKLENGFQALHARVLHADALVLVTPVYWGDLSESAKAFTDRLRRCEATLGEGSRLAGKPVIAVAAAGGSGNGTITCLLNIERWIQHVRGRVFDLIPVNRWSRPYKLVAIRDAAHTLVQEVQSEPTAH
jgi:multimeric flavodoxin WrbA